MRRGAKTTIHTLIAVNLAGSAVQVEAQPFGFFFEAPRHRVHQRRDPAPPIEAPLPVPRPHLATDPSPPDLRPGKDAPPLEVAAPPKEQPAPTATATQDRNQSTPPMPPSKPADLDEPAPRKPETTQSGVAPTTPSAVPKLDQAQKPVVSPVGASQAFTPRPPVDDPACPANLTARHVGAEPTAIGSQPDPRCTVVEPVKLTSLTLPDGAIVDFPDHPTIACTTADTFSLYVRDLLVPLAKGTFGSPAASVWTGPGLECRSRDHIFGAKLSAHGQGLAIDIAQIKLADGRLIAVGEPKTDADTGFETAARAAACGYFHTVLGPGSDSYHRTHWHFDLEVRGSGGDGKYCK